MRQQVAPGEEPVPEVLAMESVLREPASDAAIAAAEVRLRLSFPPSYRAFLLMSNGAYADPEGVITISRARMTRSRQPGLGLLPVEEVEPLAQRDPDLYKVWAEQIGSLGGSIKYDGDEVADFTALTRGALLIGSAGDGATVLVRATRAVEWQLWIFQKELVTGYKSFGSWLRMTGYAVPVSDIPAALARIVAGDQREAEGIVRLRDPAAVPVLVGALQAVPKAARIAINALASIGTAEAAMALEPFLAAGADSDALGTDAEREAHYASWHAQQALGTIKGPEAADVLARYNCHHELGIRRDPRAGPIAAKHLTPPAFIGANSLRLLGDRSYIPQLQAAAKQADHPGARMSIALARYQLGDSTVLPELQQMAADDNFHHQKRARRLLEHDTSNSAGSPSST
jgi:hypothetical protein